MKDNSVFIGNQKIQYNDDPVEGNYVDLDGELYYKITNYDWMDPFFMSIVSSSDHWMFISSNGGLTAGRKNPDNALFPYYTDDIIHTSHEITGSKTIFRINSDNKTYIWEPFSEYQKNIYDIKRNIYKNIPGNKILFEEVNADLGLQYIYTWMNSEQFGFVKKSNLKNIGEKEVIIELIDGIQNILPYGLYQQFQNEFSTLADGYKKNEIISEFGIGIYALSSIPSDKAEPSESLKVTTVWSTAQNVNKYLLCSRQLNNFRLGKKLIDEKNIKAARGAYFINFSLNLKLNQSDEWLIVAEINQDSADLAIIENMLKQNKNVSMEIEKDIENGTDKLIEIVASADGLQLSNDKLVASRHFSNVLFNTMRGGIFDDSYLIDKEDFISFLSVTNKKVFLKYKDYLIKLDNKIPYLDLKRNIKERNDNELLKLCMEYLPLTFSRRHGDPSRPWNRFSIDIKNEKNEKILNYQGNWRDIFQNWEALALSYPAFLESMIAKFLNSSTADGHNPYRVTRDGFDWEAPEPDMAWANIGYWGDHQIIYLLKLLELTEKYNSDNLTSLISENIFCYANVPYRIKKYKEILADPQNTIDFDLDLHLKIQEREKEIGSDARSLTTSDSSLYQVNLAEKLFVTLLSKLNNFIPGAGIWMNTQRPEWNDANNALVGNGSSMVTLYYIRRYVSFCINLFSKLEINSVSFSIELYDMYEEISNILDKYKSLLYGEISGKDSKLILDGLGLAGEKYREEIYKNGFSSRKKDVSIKQLIEFLQIIKKYTDHSIKSNRRTDGLYHSYNLISFKNEELEIVNLYEMLEGQVAVLSSGVLSSDESIKLLDALRKSSLYREDQNSYILYPDRQLPNFIDKNIIPSEKFNSSELLKKLIQVGDTDIVISDVKGQFHFNGDLKNANILKARLANLADEEFKTLIDDNLNDILNIYESVFNHKEFTGRSGTFYKYEGLGCIYWHMVSKLALAVQETYYSAMHNNSDHSQLEKLKNHYYNIKDGIGIHKSPDNYGAFPTDPYSHTPSFSGVQQPGMTGQVKEDIITRYGELGIQINNGTISIFSALLNKNEFLNNDELFTYYNVTGEKKTIKLNASSLVFTYCQVPFIYSLEKSNSITLILNNGERISSDKLSIDAKMSKSIFNRADEIKQVEVSLHVV